VVWACAYARAVFLSGGAAPGWREVVQGWRFVEASGVAYGVGPRAVASVLAGLWWGAASHTLADVAWSVVRKGSEIF
jgi:hypothetical protein